MASEFNTEAFTLLGVGTLIVALRTYARVSMVGIRDLMLDDYLMLLALVVYGLETAAAYSVGAMFHGLANNSMTDDQRRNLSPDSQEYALRVGGSKLQLIGWSLYTLLLWLLKTCMCVFYTRLTAGLTHMKTRTRIGFVLIGVTYVTTISAILGGCGIPFSKNWQIYPDPGNHCQPAISDFDLFFTVVLNVVTDIYLLSIPLPIFWRARIEKKKKAWLLVLFSGGIFVMMAGILRCALILTAGADGAQQAGSWAVRETFVAVVIGNIPMIQPLLTRTARKIGSTFVSTRGSEGMSHGFSLKEMVRSRNPRTANALSISSSAEDIVNSRYHSGKTNTGINVVSETIINTESLHDAHGHNETPGTHCIVST